MPVGGGKVAKRMGGEIQSGGHEKKTERRGGSGKKTTEKFSRGTIACNGCRLRKQKCGGEKPICLRCRTLEKPCVWPEQLKRGPSKGYNESLEQRLQDTEAVLSAVLDAVSESDIQLPNLDVPDIPQGDVTPSATEKKLKLEEWANFPLRTRKDVLRWRDARVSGIGGGDREDYEKRVEGSMDHAFAGDMEIDTGLVNNAERMDGNNGPMLAAEYETYIPPIQQQGNGNPPAVCVPAVDLESYIPPIQGYARPTAKPRDADHGSGILGLSKEFQDNFLW